MKPLLIISALLLTFISCNKETLTPDDVRIDTATFINERPAMVYVYIEGLSSTLVVYEDSKTDFPSIDNGIYRMERPYIVTAKDSGVIQKGFVCRVNIVYK